MVQLSPNLGYLLFGSITASINSTSENIPKADAPTRRSKNERILMAKLNVNVLESSRESIPNNSGGRLLRLPFR